MEEIISKKRCTKCGLVKPLEEFVKDVRNKDGRGSRCKDCEAERQRLYFKKNPGLSREHSRKRREAHPECDREWRKAHPEKRREAAHKWRAANPEYAHMWYEAHSEQTRERARKWTAEHPEQRRKSARKWDAEHPEQARERSRKKRARKREVEGDHFTEKEWRDLLFETGYKCLCCGETEMLLQRDHVIPLGPPCSDEITNIQPLCGHCNNSKHTRETDYREKFTI